MNPPEVEGTKEPLYKTLSAPISVQIELTQRCNLTCRHCYNYWRQESPSTFSTLSEDDLFYVLRELKTSGVFRVTLTGGEPFLFKEHVIEAVRYLTDNGIECGINTNGTTVTEEDALRLKEAGVYAILASLLSYDEATHDRITQRNGSFQKTLRGIKNVLEAGIPLVVHTVISQANEDHVYKTGRFIAGLGVKAFAATKVSPTLGAPHYSEIALSRASARRSLQSLVQLQEDFGLQTDILECYPLCLIGDAEKFGNIARRSCTAGVTTMVVGANGEVRPCIHSDEVAGNVFSEGLKESWQRMDRWRDGTLIPEICQACQYLRQCTAGCRVEAQYMGDIAGMDPYASSPADVLVPPKRKPMISSAVEELAQQRLQLNPNVRMRPEDFGGIVYGRGGGYVFLNRDSYALLQHLQQTPFSIEEITQTYGVAPEEALHFFAQLYVQKSIVAYEKAS